MQRAVLPYVARQVGEKMVLYIAREIFVQFLPCLGLGDLDEVDHISRDEAQGRVIDARLAQAVAARGKIALSARIRNAARRSGRWVSQKGGLNAGFKISFGNVNHLKHFLYPPMLAKPVIGDLYLFRFKVCPLSKAPILEFVNNIFYLIILVFFLFDQPVHC